MPNPVLMRRVSRGSAAASPLLTSLVGYWKLDEASGDRSDSHTNGLTLTDVNTVGAAAGALNNGANFAGGSSEYLERTDEALLDFSTAFSLSFWFKVGTVGANQALFSKWAYQTQGAWVVELNPSDVIRVFVADALNDGGNNYADGGTVLATGSTYHVVVVYDGSLAAGSRVKVYVNGAAETMAITGTIPASLQNASSALRFGAWSGSLTRYLTALLDEVGLWSRALTAAEVTQLRNGGTPLAYPFS